MKCDGALKCFDLALDTDRWRAVPWIAVDLVSSHEGPFSMEL